MAAVQLKSVIWLQLKVCQQLIGELLEHPCGYLFADPVDAVKLRWLDYHARIKTPMDFGTIQNRLKHDYYASPGHFRDDVRLVFRNSMQYHPKGTDYHRKTKELAIFFEQRFGALFDVERLLSEREKKKAELERKASEVVESPAKRKVQRPPEQAVREIAVSLTKVDRESLEKILRWIVRMAPVAMDLVVPDRCNAEEVYLSLASLSYNALRRLQWKIHQLDAELIQEPLLQDEKHQYGVAAPSADQNNDDGGGAGSDDGERTANESPSRKRARVAQ